MIDDERWFRIIYEEKYWLLSILICHKRQAVERYVKEGTSASNQVLSLYVTDSRIHFGEFFWKDLKVAVGSTLGDIRPTVSVILTSASNLIAPDRRVGPALAKVGPTVGEKLARFF